MRKRRNPVERETAGVMARAELESWTQRLSATAANMRASHGQCPPTALIVANRVPFSFEIILASEADKEALRALFEVAARGGADACALVAEGRRVQGPKRRIAKAIRNAKNGSPAKVAGAQDIVFVHAVSALGEVLQVFEVTARGVLKRTDPNPSASGLMSRFLSDLPWQFNSRGSRSPASSSGKVP